MTYRAELCRRFFWDFVLYYDPEFFKKRPFVEECALLMQDLADAKILKGSISLPPRAGKSYLTSLFCAWWLGKNPTLCVMRNTVSATLYNKFSYDVRAILRTSKYQAVFPTIQLAPDKQNIAGWGLTTSKQGAYFGGGVGTNIIGFGANLAISDDLYSGFAEALSPTINDATHVWKQGSHNSRMEKGCPELFIGTRWSRRDVIGAALDDGQIERAVTIPALNEQRMSFCEDVKSTAEYLDIESRTEEMIWRAEYMQEPIEAFGLLFPTNELNKFNINALSLFAEDAMEQDYNYMSIDPANKGGDYFASAHCVLRGAEIFVVDVFCNKEGSDQNNHAHFEYLNPKTINQVDYEGVLQWRQSAVKLRTMLQDKESLSFRITSPTVNKHTRIFVEAGFIKKNFYFREDYKQLPQYRIFMNLLTAYLRDQPTNGKGVNDDPPDVLAAAAKHFKRNFGHLWP